jgi:tRNA-2-methylthio-N6-dimethylallyladenosine synthase
MVRLVFGADGIETAPQAIARLVTEPGLRLSLLDFTASYPERDQAWPEATVPPRAFVTIMQGCDNFCAYCIVPFVRGRQKSRAKDAILAECRSLADRGAREITLLGQNVNSYGQDTSGDGTSFAELLDAVAAVPGIARVRFTTSHPKDLSDAVIARFADLPELCPSLHLPVQSGSDAVLAAWAGATPWPATDPGRQAAPGPAGHRPVHGPHRRFSGRDRGRFPSDPGPRARGWI